MNQKHHTLKPKKLPLDPSIPDEQVEIAAAAYHNHGLMPGQYTWHQLATGDRYAWDAYDDNQVLKGPDPRIEKWREKMLAALTALKDARG